MSALVLMESESVQAVIVTVLSVLVVVDIIGNSLVCVVITKNPDMRYVETEIGTLRYRNADVVKKNRK